VFQRRVTRDAGAIDLTAWMDALLIIITSAKELVSLIIISVRQYSVLKHALDTGHSAQIAAMRVEELKNRKLVLTTAKLSTISVRLNSGSSLA
jgi:hypothetical protein